MCLVVVAVAAAGFMSEVCGSACDGGGYTQSVEGYVVSSSESRLWRPLTFAVVALIPCTVTHIPLASMLLFLPSGTLTSSIAPEPCKGGNAAYECLAMVLWGTGPAAVRAAGNEALGTAKVWSACAVAGAGAAVAVLAGFTAVGGGETESHERGLETRSAPKRGLGRER